MKCKLNMSMHYKEEHMTEVAEEYMTDDYKQHMINNSEEHMTDNFKEKINLKMIDMNENSEEINKFKYQMIENAIKKEVYYYLKE